MSLSLLLVICVVSAAMLVAGLLAYLSGRKNRINRLFLWLSVLLSIWVPANFLGSNVIDGFFTRVFVDIDFMAALFISWVMLYFLDGFAALEHRSSFLRGRLFFFVSLSLNIVVSMLVITGDMFKVVIDSGELRLLTLGPFYFYAGLVLAYMTLAFTSFLVTYKKAKPDLRQVMRLIFVGFFVAAVTNLLTNVVFPEVISSRHTIENLNIIGYAGISTLTILIYIAITTKKLFDIRLIVARSLGYVLTLTTLLSVYIFAIFGVSSRFLGTGGLSGTQQSLYVIATLVFGFSLTPLKRFFDKITNRLFYQDAYDAQDLFDKLNKMLVGNVNLESLLKQSADLVGATLKAEFSGFVIDKTETAAQRVVLSRKKNINREEFESLSLGSKGSGKVLVVAVDELDEKRSHAKDALTKDGVAVIARLAVSDKTPVEIGYMVMGQKQSGNPYNRQDIQVLEIVANELVIAIQNALRFEEIEAFNVTLQQKVDDATRQLRITNEKLKALDETKDEFISMASHQLRTPLTAVKGYVSMVVEGDAGKLNKQQQELLNQAFSSSQRMVYLIADLLNVSRLKSGKFVIENKPTQLADVVTSEIEQLTEVAKSKGQTLVFNRPDSFPELMLDETKIRQVIMNFADNALHYTASGGHIQISLEDKGDSVEYTVTDDGMGVPKHEQHHLFTKFFRAGNAKNARPDGTGLGLFMAKKVIIAQGGAVIFKSEEGKGSTFGFTFPKGRLAVNAKQKL